MSMRLVISSAGRRSAWVRRAFIFQFRFDSLNPVAQASSFACDWSGPLGPDIDQAADLTVARCGARTVWTEIAQAAFDEPRALSGKAPASASFLRITRSGSSAAEQRGLLCFVRLLPLGPLRT